MGLDGNILDRICLRQAQWEKISKRYIHDILPFNYLLCFVLCELLSFFCTWVCYVQGSDEKLSLLFSTSGM